MAAVLIALLVLLVIAAVLSPWRWPASLGPARRPDARIDALRAELADLQAARDAKYREIRDAELDRATGKLSQTDFEAVDSGLRAEAVTILRDLDRAEDRLKRRRRRSAEAAAAVEASSEAEDPPVDAPAIERLPSSAP